MLKKLQNMLIPVMVALFFTKLSSVGAENLNNSLIISCSGSGPSSDIAERMAIGQCIVKASDRINGSFHVQTLSIETEKDAAYHQEVSADRKVNGLNCNIQKEEIKEKDETYTANLTCKFDLTKVKIEDIPKNAPEPQRIIQSSTRQLLLLVTIPLCSSVIIRGKEPRVEQCNSNPKSLLLKEGDQELIVRAEHCKPKHIDLGLDHSSILEVYLYE